MSRTFKEMTLKPSIAVHASELDQDSDSRGPPALQQHPAQVRCGLVLRNRQVTLHLPAASSDSAILLPFEGGNQGESLPRVHPRKQGTLLCIVYGTGLRRLTEATGSADAIVMDSPMSDDQKQGHRELAPWYRLDLRSGQGTL